METVLCCTGLLVKFIFLVMSCDDLESMCSVVSLLLQPSRRLHELPLPSKSFSSIDARHALKLCEMSCVVLRERMEGFFFRQSCAELVAVSYQACFPRSHCGHFGFVIAGPKCSSARTSTVQVSSGAFLHPQHKGLSNSLFRFACTSHR